MISAIFFTLLSVGLSAPAASEIYSPFCPLECPEVREGNNLIFTHIYAMSHSPKTKFADWTAYEVNPANYGPTTGRPWKNNPMIDKSEVLESGDYRGANKALGVNKGHMTPLAAFAGNQYWYETNYLSNVVPQQADLNQGPWEKLEKAIREAATYSEPLYVITGTLYETEMERMPKADEAHVVPSGFYKLIYDEKRNGVAFIMEQNTARDIGYCEKAVSLKSLQGRAQVVLPSLKESQQISIKIGC